MRWTALACAFAAAGCQCSGRNLDAQQYRCGLDDPDCGPGWSCVHFVCVPAGTDAGPSPNGVCDLLRNPGCEPGFGCLLQDVLNSTAGDCVTGCDPVVQDCGPGQRCTASFNAGGAFRCVPNGTQTTDGPCQPGGDTDDCAAGLACVNERDEFRCEPFCTEATGCAGPRICAWFVGGVGGYALACMAPECDLLHTETCVGECVPWVGGSTACVLTGSGSEGSNCKDHNGCVAGTLCTSDDDAGVCARVCNVDAGAPSCAPPQHCTAEVGPAAFPLLGGAGLCR